MGGITNYTIFGNDKMQYPLTEQIGEPELLVGREKEFKDFDKWLKNISKRLSKSRVILARRKSGKTAFVQRIFNKLWSENGDIIPFYYSFSEIKTWYPDLAIKYYQAFASQYISFVERDEMLVYSPLSLEKIKEYGLLNSIKLLVDDVTSIIHNKNNNSYDLMWDIACSAPHRFASVFNKKILVILDEFQYISRYIYRNSNCEKNPDNTLPGSWHNLVESKIAPMLVTGSYVGWLAELMHRYLEAGRLKQIYMSPYLTEEEGLLAVYKYAQIYEEPITHESAIQINKLCMSDPFFISCVIQSRFDGKDLINQEGVVNTVNFEISDRRSEMSLTWGEYIENTLHRVNDIHAKNIVLFMSKNSDRDWTPKELKEELKLDLSVKEINEKLRMLVKSDLIEEGVSDIRYQGLRDGTLYLILRNRFEEEISTFMPDLKKDFNEELEKLKKDKKSLQGKLNNLIGKVAEFQLMTEFRTKKIFSLSLYFKGVSDLTVLNIIDTKLRFKFQRQDGKEMEIDVIAESDCSRVVLVEVKKTKEKIGANAVKFFIEKIEAYNNVYSEKKVLPAFFSVGGFTDEAVELCKDNNIGTAENINYLC